MTEQSTASIPIGRVLVIIPTYNERDNIELIIERVFVATPAVDVLVVDDGSPDGTGKIADALAADDTRVSTLHRSEKAGLGAAYRAGFAWGLARGYDVLVEMDADGSHAPEQLPRLLGTLTRADLVLGSRWIPGGRVINWPKSREVLSRGANVYARVALGVGLHDATGGYRAYRRQVLERIDYAEVTSRGYCFQIEMAWRAVRAGFRVVEVPITFVERERGESKMDSSVVGEAFLRVAEWGAKHRVEQLGNALRGRLHRPRS